MQDLHVTFPNRKANKTYTLAFKLPLLLAKSRIHFQNATYNFESLTSAILQRYVFLSQQVSGNTTLSNISFPLPHSLGSSQNALH